MRDEGIGGNEGSAGNRSPPESIEDLTAIFKTIGGGLLYKSHRLNEIVIIKAALRLLGQGMGGIADISHGDNAVLQHGFFGTGNGSPDKFGGGTPLLHHGQQEIDHSRSFRQRPLKMG